MSSFRNIPFTPMRRLAVVLPARPLSHGLLLVRTKRRCFSSGSPNSSQYHQQQQRQASSPISGHMFFFSLLMVPVLGVTIYAGRYGPDEATLEAKIRERYPSASRGGTGNDSKDKPQAMAEFFQQAIFNPDSGAQDSRLAQVLHGGKTDVPQRRLHAVDAELYGTQAGVDVKERTLLEIERVAAEKREQKRQRRRKQRQNQTEQKSEPQPETLDDPSTGSSTQLSKTNQIQLASSSSVATVILVGSVAALAGFWMGGGRTR